MRLARRAIERHDRTGPRRRVALAFAAAPLLLGGLTACDPVLNLTVNSTVDAHDTNPGDGVCARIGNPAQCSLRAAIDEANAATSTVISVAVPAGDYAITLPGADDTNVGGDFDVLAGKQLILLGSGTVQIYGTATERIFDVFGTIGLDHVTLRGGHTTGDGGAIRATGTQTILTASTVRVSSAAGRGGGVALLAGTLIARTSTIEGNTAGVAGGGIHVAAGATADLAQSTISGNSVDPVGQGVSAPFDAPDGADGVADAAASNPPIGTVPAPPAADGSLPVIVEFAADLVPESQLDADGIDAQRDALADARDAMIDSLPGGADRVRTTYETVPLVATLLQPGEIAAVEARPDVVKVHRDELSAPDLDTSIPFIRADDTETLGADGEGQTVAIIDTGVDNDHPMFAGGKVVAEACRAQGATFGDAAGDCPNGTPSQDGAETGENCARTDLGCNHGTHVASTAAGSLFNAGGVDYRGVAPAADVIAVQVFSLLLGAASCSGAAECVRSYSSDQIAGLDFVYANRLTYDISSVNMSLGGGGSTTACDGDVRKGIIDNLRAAGIITAISAGNSGFTNQVGAPGCISTAFTVGAVGNNTDAVASFSNSAAMVDVLAPGQSIFAGIPGGAMASMSGTSMAAPHTTGAIAVLRSAFPAASAASIEDALRNTGIPVTDSKAPAVTKPRIDVLAALAAIGGPGIGGGVSVQGTITMVNVTIANNNAVLGGGLSTTGAVTTLASLIASSPTGKDCARLGGTFTSSGSNLDSDGSCGLVGPNDRSSMNPVLGSLSNNGGSTRTHLPTVASPAVNWIPVGTAPCDGSQAADQRGTARPQGGACDIGSTER